MTAASVASNHVASCGNLERWRLASDEAYWRRLIDESSTTPPPRSASARASGEDAGRDAESFTDEIRQIGLSKWSKRGDEGALSAAHSVIHSVTKAGWPAVFALTSDSLWQLCDDPAVWGAARAACGEAVQQMPGVWIFDTDRQSSTWAPHIDDTMGDDRKHTVWLSFENCGLDDGCIFYVPQNVLPHIRQRWAHAERMKTAHLVEFMHQSRCAPVERGDVLAWRTDLLHWRGPRGPQSGRRTVLGLEFGVDVDDGRDRRQKLTFAERLRWIGLGLLRYGTDRQREPHAADFADLGSLLAGG